MKVLIYECLASVPPKRVICYTTISMNYLRLAPGESILEKRLYGQDYS